MANTFTTIIIASLAASLFLALFLIPINELNQASTYNSGIDTTNLTSLNKLDILNKNVTTLSNKVTEETKVTTEQSESSFYTNAFTIGKFIITGGPFKIIDGMLRDFIRVAHVPVAVYVFVSAVLGLILAFAVIKGITGR